jgi:hypothetical protein
MQLSRLDRPLSGWSKQSAYLRGQILYRAAEMPEIAISSCKLSWSGQTKPPRESRPRKPRSRRVDRAVAICLAVLLPTNYFGYAAYLWRHQLFFWAQTLPFQLCDWAMVTVIVALVTGQRSWFDVSYS